MILFSTVLLSAQNNNDESIKKDIQKGIVSITEEDLKTHLSYLASEELMGRDIGEPGQKEAAKYLSTFFKQIFTCPPRKRL